MRNARWKPKVHFEILAVGLCFAFAELEVARGIREALPDISWNSATEAPTATVQFQLIHVQVVYILCLGANGCYLHIGSASLSGIIGLPRGTLFKNQGS